MITTEWATADAVEGMVLRAQDVAELAITSPGTPVSDILREAVNLSFYAELIRLDGQAAIVYGVVPTHLYGVGAIWMLATDDIERMRGYVKKNSRDKVAMLNRMFPVLMNYVHADNSVAIRWLAWCGFDVYAPDVHGLCYFRKGMN
jgi:hypothetical protein